MKKIIFPISLLILSFLFTKEVQAINVSSLTSVQTSCSEANVSDTFYMSASSGTYFLYDTYSSTNERVISKNSTNVWIWQSDTSLVTWCTTDADWHRISTYAPGNNTSVIAVWANCTINRPTDNSNRTFQIVYNVANYGITSGTDSYDLQYFTSTGSVDSNTPDGTKSFTNVGFNDFSLHGNECYNVELQYCWDGVINGTETCDTADATQSGWWTSGCSSSCQPDNGWWGWWGCGWSNSGWGGGGWWGDDDDDNVCWDGVLQRPNSNGENEQCDFGSTADWWVCNKATCNWWDLTAPGQYDGDITVPNNGRISFGPKNDIIVWHGINPFSETLQKPYIQNESDFSVQFDNLCTVKKAGSDSLDGWSPQCEPLGVIQPWEKRSFINYPNFIWNKNNITGSYGDNTLLVTLEDKGTLYDSAYFTAPFKVRVSKPSVATTWGGTSFISDTTDIANIKDVADEGRENPNVWENTNFVWAGISTWSLSSSIKTIDDASIVSDISDDGLAVQDSLNNLLDNEGVRSLITVTDLWDFESYNGIEDVFILKDKNFRVLPDTFNSIAGARTYIIENWDLLIDADIDYPSNIAFVVKSWDIKIQENVNLISGTYISIAGSTIGGKIIWTAETNEVLKVRGSLYGDISELVLSRTYVKENPNGQINVWTIVSFGSSLFRKPAPLTGQFIWEYLSSEKIAK